MITRRHALSKSLSTSRRTRECAWLLNKLTVKTMRTTALIRNLLPHSTSLCVFKSNAISNFANLMRNNEDLKTTSLEDWLVPNRLISNWTYVRNSVMAATTPSLIHLFRTIKRVISKPDPLRNRSLKDKPVYLPLKKEPRPTLKHLNCRNRMLT